MKLSLLITGGCGFIGVNFVQYWRKRHPEDFIINYDALTYAGCRDSQTAYEGQKNYRFIQGDILDRDQLNKIFSGTFESVPKPTIIVHFAAETHVDRSIQDPSVFVKTNVMGTQTLLEAALQHGKIRFHHISTDEVFGELQAMDPSFDETSAYRPRSPYAASKAGSDHLVRAYAATYGLPVTISNCSNNYGPYQFPEKFISLAITNLLQGKKVPVYGEGKNIRDWLYVEDHCEAIDRIISSDPGDCSKGPLKKSFSRALGDALKIRLWRIKASARSLTKGGSPIPRDKRFFQRPPTYCIGGNSEMSNIDVVRLILKIMGKDESWIEFVPDRPGHDFRYAMSTQKMEKTFGWQPKMNFEQGIQKTIVWYQENEKWWKSRLSK